MKRKQNPLVPLSPDDDRLYITPAEVARLLSISRTQVYDLLAKGHIPGRRTVGERVRVYLPLLMAWAESGTPIPPS